MGKKRSDFNHSFRKSSVSKDSKTPIDLTKPYQKGERLKISKVLLVVLWFSVVLILWYFNYGGIQDWDYKFLMSAREAMRNALKPYWKDISSFLLGGIIHHLLVSLWLAGLIYILLIEELIPLFRESLHND